VRGESEVGEREQGRKAMRGSIEKEGVRER
jgi:hypothetical protein